MYVILNVLPLEFSLEMLAQSRLNPDKKSFQLLSCHASFSFFFFFFAFLFLHILPEVEFNVCY